MGGDSTNKSGEAGAVCFRRSETREAYQPPEPKTRPLAAMAIAFVDVRVLDVRGAGAPGVGEELAGKAEEGGVAEDAAAVAQIDGLPVPVVARGADVDAQPES